MRFIYLWVALAMQMSVGTVAMAEIIGSCHNYFNRPDAIGTLRSDGTIIRNDPIAVIQNFTNVVGFSVRISCATKSL